MTLDTRVYVLDPVSPQDVFAFCRALIGAEDRHTYSDSERFADEGQRVLSNDPGQGLPAWLMIYYRPGAPRITAEQAAAHDDDCNMPGSEDYVSEWGPCDGNHTYRRANWLTVSFDTAYGYSDDRGYGCGDLHAEYVARLGQWLDSLGVRWEWMNEFTGEVHAGCDRLSDLGRGGRDAADWLKTAVLPAITGREAGA
ncbi:MAG: hypothetical protein ACTHON_09255 [Humibacter sp.]